MTFRSRTASCTRATELSRATARGRMACGNRMVSRRGRMARSVGTSARLISPPLDSKSGVRSSLSLMFLSDATGPPRRGPGPVSALEGGQGAKDRVLLLRRARLLPLLAVAAQHRERQRLEPRLRDVPAALRAGAVGPGVEPVERLVDAAERVRLHLHQGELHVLREVRH